MYQSLDTKRNQEFVWPAWSRNCGISNTQAITEVLKYCDKRRTIIQAGGNCGIWPKEFAQHFERVITFEPDLLNFRCLVENVTEGNVFPYRAALGSGSGNCEIYEGTPHNCGDLRVRVGKGNVPVMAIDSLGIQDCDLIYLDIQGMEAAALNGGIQTIGRSRPVVAYEWANLGEDPLWFMETERYEKATVIGSDQVWVPMDIVRGRNNEIARA